MQQSSSPLARTTRRGPPFLPARQKTGRHPKMTLRVLGTQAGKDANTTTRTSPFSDLVCKLLKVLQELLDPLQPVPPCKGL